MGEVERRAYLNAYKKNLTPEQKVRYRAKAAEAARKWRATPDGKAKQKAISERRRLKLKREALDAYGGSCACCGEQHMAFLTLDHTNNDGAAHRRALGLVRERAGGATMYNTLKKLGWPTHPPLRVLCYNCNCGRRANGGVCPHEAAR